MSNAPQKFISDNGLSFRAERIDSRPDGLMRNSLDSSRHFRIEFRSLKTDFCYTTFLTQGSAHAEEPTAVDTLECLAIDARSVVDCSDVLDFASEFGWELNSPESIDQLRKAFAGCNETLAGLGRLLGNDSRDELLDLDFDEE